MNFSCKVTERGPAGPPGMPGRDGVGLTPSQLEFLDGLGTKVETLVQRLDQVLAENTELKANMAVLLVRLNQFLTEDEQLRLENAQLREA